MDQDDGSGLFDTLVADTTILQALEAEHDELAPVEGPSAVPSPPLPVDPAPRARPRRRATKRAFFGHFDGDEGNDDGAPVEEEDEEEEEEDDDDDVDERELKRRRRAQRNRQAAHASRQRKKELQARLEDDHRMVVQEGGRLEARLTALDTENTMISHQLAELEGLVSNFARSEPQL